MIYKCEGGMNLNLKIKQRIIFLGLILTILITASCANVTNNNIDAQKTKESTQEVIYTNEQETKFKNGYPIEDYTILLTEKQQKSETEKQMFVNNNFFEPDFIKQKKNIDLSKKINLLVYSMQYSEENNSYTLGTFFINTSDFTIEKMSFDIDITFKYIEESVHFKINFADDDFITLPPKGLIVQSISGNVPPELSEPLLKNKTSDITFEITNLEINGEQVDNTNEN